ncbi:UxaA family hydrolase [Lysinibacillus sp. NPDC093210]|uniref:UxaA family hydrolase n=1 Tax=Lysinibacillus sp. NPDC093210 TaxID=3364133 RepID=UPI003816C713
MAEMAYQQGITCIVMDEKDNVTTLLTDVKKGESVIYTKGNQTYELTLQQDVNFGHKVAIAPINKAEEIVKYGEVIGAATIAIQTGEHVHVHNIEGIRGRGDKSAGGVKR